MISRLGPTLSVGAGVLGSMFFFTYLPQVAMLAFVEGPMAPMAAIPLVLSESSTLFNVISRTFLIEDALIDTFDGTLMARDMASVVSEGRQVKAGSDPMAKLGKRKSHRAHAAGRMMLTLHASGSGEEALRSLHTDRDCSLFHVPAAQLHPCCWHGTLHPAPGQADRSQRTCTILPVERHVDYPEGEVGR